MKPSATQTLAGLVVASLAAGVMLYEDGDHMVPLAPEVLTLLPDGGSAYVMPARNPQGDIVLVTTTAKCMRRPVHVSPAQCSRSVQTPSGSYVTVDPGELNRFRAEDAVGSGCQRVACAVVAGQDASLEEAELLQRERELLGRQ